MRLEGLLAELFVATALHRVDLKSVRVTINHVVLRKHVRDGQEGEADGEHHHDHDFGVGHFRVAKIGNVLSDVVCHLGCRSWRAIIVFHHAIMELGRHGNDHVIIVGIEVAALRDVKTERWCIMVACQQVVGVVGQTRLHVTSLGQIWGPDALISVLGLMDCHVGWPDAIIDPALTIVPLLKVVTAVLLVTRMHLGQVNHLFDEFRLLETLIDEQIVFLVHCTVASLARTGKDLEAASQRC